MVEKYILILPKLIYFYQHFVFLPKGFFLLFLVQRKYFWKKDRFDTRGRNCLALIRRELNLSMFKCLINFIQINQYNPIDKMSSTLFPMDKPTQGIRQYYSSKSVFLTGATGFIGKVIVEKLLRSCPSIKNIYILIRPKKGLNCCERIDQIFSLPVSFYFLSFRI